MAVTTWISVDVEADGPLPGKNSMLSLGAVAIQNEVEVGTWTANLHPLPNLEPNPATTEWWKRQPEAWEIIRYNRRLAADAMPEFVQWCMSWGAGRVGIAWPVAFDMPFINWYSERFAGDRGIKSWLDIRSYVMGATRSPGYFSLDEAAMKAVQIDKIGLTEHVALDDAIEQGRLFVAFMRLYGTPPQHAHE